MSFISGFRIFKTKTKRFGFFIQELETNRGSGEHEVTCGAFFFMFMFMIIKVKILTDFGLFIYFFWVCFPQKATSGLVFQR